MGSGSRLVRRIGRQKKWEKLLFLLGAFTENKVNYVVLISSYTIHTAVKKLPHTLSEMILHYVYQNLDLQNSGQTC